MPAHALLPTILDFLAASIFDLDILLYFDG